MDEELIYHSPSITRKFWPSELDKYNTISQNKGTCLFPELDHWCSSSHDTKDKFYCSLHNSPSFVMQLSKRDVLKYVHDEDFLTNYIICCYYSYSGICKEGVYQGEECYSARNPVSIYEVLAGLHTQAERKISSEVSNGHLRYNKMTPLLEEEHNKRETKYRGYSFHTIPLCIIREIARSAKNLDWEEYITSPPITETTLQKYREPYRNWFLDSCAPSTYKSRVCDLIKYAFSDKEEFGFLINGQIGWSRGYFMSRNPGCIFPEEQDWQDFFVPFDGTETTIRNFSAFEREIRLAMRNHRTDAEIRSKANDSIFKIIDDAVLLCFNDNFNRDRNIQIRNEIDTKLRPEKLRRNLINLEKILNYDLAHLIMHEYVGYPETFYYTFSLVPPLPQIINRPNKNIQNINQNIRNRIQNATKHIY